MFGRKQTPEPPRPQLDTPGLIMKCAGNLELRLAWHRAYLQIRNLPEARVEAWR